MKKCIVVCVLLLFSYGCGDPASDIGFGAGVGYILTNTITGAKADLGAREQKLIELYNQGVSDGMSAKDLDELEQAIVDTRLMKKSVEGGEGLLSVDWEDPKQTGGAIGLIATLAGLWFLRKRLKSVSHELSAKNEAINKFEGTSEPEVASKLHDIIKDKMNGG